MNKEAGFSFTEVIASTSLAILIILLILPLYFLIQNERMNLIHRIDLADYIFNEIVTSKSAMDQGEHVISMNSIETKIGLTSERDSIKICANWVNKQKREEELCLYANHQEQ